MKRLAILTPHPSDTRYSGRWQASYARLAEAFAARGVTTMPAPWSDPPPAADAALAVLSWGYHQRLDAWLARLDAGGPRLINSAALLRWNTRKTYLLELAEKGVAVVPTRVVDAVTPTDLAQAFEAFGCDAVVVKPQVSAGAHLTMRLSRGEAPPDLPPGPVLIQPFLPAVGGEGELSLFYFGGSFSHAARKVAADGDFRIQPQFGGTFSRLEPEPEAFTAAEAALAAAPKTITYGRVDLIRDLDGRLCLMELEAIEPDLCLDLVPEAAETFVAAVVGAVSA